MVWRKKVRTLGLALLLGQGALLGQAPPLRAEARAAPDSTASAMCRIIDAAAARNDLPTPFLAKLIWRESRFRASALSPVGAQGVAQFMPGTAQERGLGDPFDPEQAIPEAARFLADLRKRFGNLGLAAAAYNGGPQRVTNWLGGSGELPPETKAYVDAITGQPVDHWAAVARGSDAEREETPDSTRTPCLQVLARLQRPEVGTSTAAAAPPPLAPWGVQIAGSFSKAEALAMFNRSRGKIASVIGDLQPMVIGTRLRFRGSGAFYRVRLPSQSRVAAAQLCDRIHSAGGACIVLRT